MGYACPVCGDPQADGHHLANHLAFTAMLGDADHEAWLDERVPEWADTDAADLAAAVTDHAEATDYPQVFEDTAGESSDEHDHPGHENERDGSADDVPDPLDGTPADGYPPAAVGDVADRDDPAMSDRAADEVIAEARELTRRRRANADGETGAGDDPAEESGESTDGTGEETP